MNETVRSQFKDAINAVQEELLARVKRKLEELASEQGGKITPEEALEVFRQEFSVP
jgi:hypothetical protein